MVRRSSLKSITGSWHDGSPRPESCIATVRFSPGSMPLSTELFQEGIIIPPIKRVDGGQRNERDEEEADARERP